jgi:hypothetical protein
VGARAAVPAVAAAQPAQLGFAGRR